MEPCFCAGFDIFVLPETKLQLLSVYSCTLSSMLMEAEFKLPESKSPEHSIAVPANGSLNVFFLAVND